MSPQKGVRGQTAALPANPNRVGLPMRPFLYTVDQIAVLFNLEPETIIKSYLYFEGRSTGIRHRYLLAARNIAPPSLAPEWRVPERELIRWCKYKGFKVYEVGVVTH